MIKGLKKLIARIYGSTEDYVKLTSPAEGFYFWQKRGESLGSILLHPVHRWCLIKWVVYQILLYSIISAFIAGLIVITASVAATILYFYLSGSFK